MYEDAAAFELKIKLGRCSIIMGGCYNGVHLSTIVSPFDFLSLMELLSVIKGGSGDASSLPAVSQLLAILQVYMQFKIRGYCTEE